MNEKTAHGIARGLACGPHCVLRQWFNRRYQSCPIMENMFVNEKTAHGIGHGLIRAPHCVLRQWFNRQYQSCPTIKNMFVKVKTKEYYFVYCWCHVLECFGIQRSPMTSHCLCLREERTVTCLILRIVNFLFYLKVSYSFFISKPKFFLSQPKFFHSQLDFL